MRRVISVWFPTFPIDRLQRIGAGPPDGGPFVTSMHDGRRRVVTAAGAAAQAIGIMSGMPLANAQALVPGLGIVEAEPDVDATALTQLAVWCLRYAPPLFMPNGSQGRTCDSTCRRRRDALTTCAGRR